ncbi:ATP-binding protein [Pseudomonas sp. Q1-7]|uniref:ATP-binding protein n=1 Tax=Pseudomonas sp. Q1-7 TaxID=3020843 RepID=UPI002301AEC5|nr:transporter substrate-binding domain-containing protein [Pseudomonas sp. Q1-7]
MNPHLLAGIALILFAGPLNAFATPQSLSILSRPINLDGAIQAAQEDRLWLQARGELRLAIGNDLPPFDLTSSGQDYEGLTADVAGLLAEVLGVPVRVLRYPDRDLALEAVARGEADLLSTANDFEAQDPRLVLSRTYTPDMPTLVSRLDDRRSLPKDLSGVRVAVSRDYLPLDRISSRYPQAIISVHATPQAALRAVAMDGSDIYLGDMIVANYLINHSFANHLRIAGLAELRSGGFGLAMRREEHRLRRILDDVLAHVSFGEQSALIKRWSGGASPALFQPALQLSAEERAWVREHPVVRVATYGNYTPVTFFDGEGSYHGITADVLEQVATRSGLRFEIIRTASMAGMLESLESGAADMIGALSPRPSLPDSIAFSRPYMSVNFVTVTPRKPDSATNLSALSGKRVAVTRNYILNDYLQKTYPQLTLTATDTLLESLELVARGGAEAAVMSGNAAEYYVQRMFAEELRISEQIDVAEQSIAFAVDRDNPLLRSVLDKALAAIPPDDLAVLVNQRWRSNVEVSNQPWRDYRQIITHVVLVAGLLLLVSLVWNAYLRHQVRLRIQAEQALREQVQFMESLINGTPHPIYVRDLQGNLLLCNDDYLRTFDLERQALIDQPLPEQLLGEPAETAQLREDYRRVMEDGVALEHDREVHIRGQRLTLYHWLLPYKDFHGRVKGVIGGWIDISERRRLIDALQAAKEHADQASRAKSTFLATMSHEIRTPMNAIIGMLELTLKRAGQGNFDRSSIEVAYDSAKNLLELIGDILDIARIESGRLSLTPVRANLRELVESVVRVFDGVARQKGLDLRLEFDSTVDSDVLIDPMRFKQILSNLVSNAIKFTESGGVRVHVTGSGGEGNHLALQLDVEDSGIGIAEEDLRQLFQPFAQASNIDRNVIRGAGLGLVISRTLCEMMGGTLDLHSRLGEGSRVTLNLNLQRLDECPNVPQPACETANREQRRLNALVVDDHGANRELLVQQLTFLGHRATSAENGAEALVIWRNGYFDLVISDCHMPKMNGYQLAQRIRELERAEGRPRCRLLGYTANAQNEELERCLQAGMDACLFKPASLCALKEQLAELEALAAPAVCDLEALSQMTGGEPRLNAHIINELLRANHQDIAGLRELAGRFAPQEVAELAHKIKGAAKIIRAWQLIEACQQLEERCATPLSRTELEAGAEHVAHAVEQLHRTLREALGSEPVDK